MQPAQQLRGADFNRRSQLLRAEAAEHESVDRIPYPIVMLCGWQRRTGQRLQ